jgi:hypothetical protein
MRSLRRAFATTDSTSPRSAPRRHDDYETPFRWTARLRALVIEVPDKRPADLAAEVRATLKAE